jgi:hypothetical protein
MAVPNQRPFACASVLSDDEDPPTVDIRSSCLSGHAAARTPRSLKGILGFHFHGPCIADQSKVRAYVDLWFENLKSGNLFDPDPNKPGGEPPLWIIPFS